MLITSKSRWARILDKCQHELTDLVLEFHEIGVPLFSENQADNLIRYSYDGYIGFNIAYIVSSYCKSCMFKQTHQMAAHYHYIPLQMY